MKMPSSEQVQQYKAYKLPKCWVLGRAIYNKVM